ncbi:MAG: aryl-sulfate sulfotransferase [Lachnospiraceae bacterium]|nr:aryl-sulfate sulfotransferase [Lachnospiraceae bacterium]
MRKLVGSVLRKAFHKGRDIYNSNIKTEKWLRKQSESFDISFAYNGRSYETNIENSLLARAVDSRKKDMYIASVLDSKEYTLNNPLIIRNPYKISLLTVLVVFNTEEECKIEYTIKGQDNANDFDTCDEHMSTRHRVPVVGLYAGKISTVNFRAVNKEGKVIGKKTIKVMCEKIDRKIAGKIEFKVHKEESLNEFFFVSGGYSGGAYGFDRAGNIRIALSEIPMHYGVYMFDNGRFLFPELKMRRPVYGNAHSVVTHEMDLMGRTYHTYYNPKGFHHWACEEKEGGNILTVSSSLDDTYMENVILELDRKTGMAIHETSMNNLFDKTYVTRNDWVHLNAMDYIPEENTVIACMRNIHTIAKINLDTEEILWIMTNPEFFKGTEQEDKCLTPVGDIDWFFQQHGVKIIHEDIDGNPDNLHIMLYDNHAVNRRPVPWHDGDEDYSYAEVFTIDEKARTFKQEKRFRVPVCSTRCNNEFYYDDNRMFVMCARLKNGKELGYLGEIFEFDYKTGECLNEIALEKDFFTAHSIDINVAEMSMDASLYADVFLGKLYEPVRNDTLGKEFRDAVPMPDNIKEEIKFRTMGDVLQLKAHDHDIQKIVLYSDDNVYTQNFDDSTQPLEIFKNQAYFISMPMSGMKNGKYRLALCYKDEYYTTGYTVDIK